MTTDQQHRDRGLDLGNGLYSQSPEGGAFDSPNVVLSGIVTKAPTS